MQLDTTDLVSIHDFLIGLSKLTYETGIDIMDHTAIWSDGEVLGFISINGGTYEYKSE